MGSETGQLCNEVSILVVEAATYISCGSNGSVPSVDVSSVGDRSGKLWHPVVNGGSSSVLARIVWWHDLELVWAAWPLFFISVF